MDHARKPLYRWECHPFRETPHPGGGSQWDVYVGSTVVGTVTSPQFGAYIGTVGECGIGAVYDTVSVAAAAVVTAHQRAAEL